MTWKLQAITDEILGSEISIERDMLVGRHQDADVILQSAEISRRHAAFILKDQALYLQDLNSSNGTYVNDVRIDHETILKNDDIVQFASLKFLVLAPTAASVAESEISEAVDQNKPEPVIETIPQDIQQPSEAIATSEYVAEKSDVDDQNTNNDLTQAQAPEQVDLQQEKTPAQEMTQQGMPTLADRATETPVSAEGMPERVAVPKPAPIPEGVDIQAKTQPEVVTPNTQPTAQAQQEEQKNASVGLISIVVLIVLAILAWLFFK